MGSPPGQAAQAQEGLCAGETLRHRDMAGDSFLTRLRQGRTCSEGSSWGGGVRGDALFAGAGVLGSWRRRPEQITATQDVGTWGTPQRFHFFSFCGFCTNPSGSSPWFWQDNCRGRCQPQRFLRSRGYVICALAATKPGSYLAKTTTQGRPVAF